MKRLSGVLLLILTLAMLLVAGSSHVLAQTPTPPTGTNGDQFVMGGDYRLRSGQTLSGNLYIVGGSSYLEGGSVVQGDVFMLGGSASVGGEVGGDISILGGSISLQATALVKGDINTVGGSLSEDPGSQVLGSRNSEIPGNFHLDVPRAVENLPRVSTTSNPASQALWALLQSLMVGVLAAVVLMALPKPTTRVMHAASAQPAMSGLAGVLTLIAFPFAIALLVITMATIILIPFSLVAILLVSFGLVAACVFGYVAFGYFLGQRFAQQIGQDWAAPVQAGVGAMGVTFMLRLIGLVPGIGGCIDGALSAVIGLIGLGAVVLSFFGTRDYPTPVPPPVTSPLPSPIEPIPPAGGDVS